MSYTEFNDKLTNLMCKLEIKRGDDAKVKQYKGRVYLAIDGIPQRVIELVGKSLFKYNVQLNNIPQFKSKDDEEPSGYDWTWFFQADFDGDIKADDRDEAKDIKYLINLVRSVLLECDETERIDIYYDIMDLLDLYVDHSRGKK
jgi:hypothetical protein